MTKFLFVENREKTGLWEQVALRLQARGHEIFWLVQNPWFVPGSFSGKSNTHILSYPDQQKMQSELDAEIFKRYPALLGERGRIYFNSGASHYHHYSLEIQRIMDEVRPDMIVGESTLFHELMTIQEARLRDIPYIHPSANRYPSGRFALFCYDTQLPLGGSGESLDESEAMILAEGIAIGKEIPFYMRVPGRMEKMLQRSKWVVTRARVWGGRLTGERYNTPSLARKAWLQRQLSKNTARWDALAGVPAKRERTVLYPLQLQPETNIDIWGSPYGNQVGLVKDFLLNSPADIQIAVKSNPKAKYEMSQELLRLAESEPRVCLLPRNMSMAQAQSLSMGAVTVSGTVGFEAIFGRGRCISLKHPLVQQEFPGFHADTPAQAIDKVLNDPQAGTGDVSMGAKLMQRLVAQSFPGLLSDPFSHPQCLDEANVEAVAFALTQALQHSASLKPQVG